MRQQHRLVALVVYSVLLVALSQALFATPLPATDIRGLWFYFAFAALLLGEYLVEPFFSRPADAVANAAAMFIAVSTASNTGAAVTAETFFMGQRILAAYALLVGSVAVLAIAGKDSGPGWQTAARIASEFVSVAGRAKWMFSVAFFAAVWAAFADRSPVIAALYLSWFVIVAVRPVEWLLRRIRRTSRASSEDAELIQVQDPAIAVLRLPRGSSPQLGDRLTLDGRVKGTVVDMTESADRPVVRVSLDEPSGFSKNSFAWESAKPAGHHVIGYVDAGTDLETIRVRTVPAAADAGMKEGRLLSVEIGDSSALYQVIGGEVVNRSEGGLARQLVLVEARKLGRWSAKETAFEVVEWIPEPGSTVQLIGDQKMTRDPYAFIGHVPGTGYGIAVDPHLAVTHNTAILGILGSGKTHVAWELIWRMLATGIRVVVLDISGKYAEHFKEVYPPDLERDITERINNAIAAEFPETRVRDNDAANFNSFKRELAAILDWFLESASGLLVINPNSFVVRRMEGKPYGGHAQTLADVTMVEVTRLVAEHLLNHLQKAADQPPEGEARLCLVLEEAHSLVPEWNSTTTDSDKQAVNGTVRALLQGRKYGLGTLLITQRTANVTKSILNQCNTVFGLRAFDATGMGFLENYIGPSHARLLATLRDRQAVVYGRASTCRAPLLVRINDADDFRKEFLAKRLKDVPPTQPLAVAKEPDEPEDVELGF